MRYGIFGDVHGNLEAFQEVIEQYKKEDIDRYISVGDIVGYGADPKWCIEEVKRLKAGSVCGNHDWASAGRLSPGYFNHAAQEAVKWTQGVLDGDEKEFLKSLTLVIDEENFSIVHGSLEWPDLFYYITDTGSAYRCFQKMERRICFIGHSHVAEIFMMAGNKITHTFGNRVDVERGVKYIVNVGSVGQPRDRNPLAAFAIYDTKDETVEIKRVRYDIESAKNKILKQGLPHILGYRLLEGR